MPGPRINGEVARARSARTLALAVAIACAAVSQVSASAATLVVEGPPSCIDPAALADDVSELVGKPVASIPGADFRVQVVGTARQRWRLRLETVDRGRSGEAATVRGSREIEGTSCAELAEAAALAIAVSIRAIDEPALPHEVVSDGKASAAASPPLAVQSSLPVVRTRWAMGGAVGVIVEAGVLPRLGPGVELEGQLRRGALILGLRGAWFLSQDTASSGESRGSFQLTSGGAAACFAPQRVGWKGIGCAGFELGRLAGTGLGIARPQTGASLWSAGQAELGVTHGIAGDTAFFLRAGVAVPIVRPVFVIDGSRVVYQPSRVAGTLTGGVQLEF